MKYTKTITLTIATLMGLTGCNSTPVAPQQYNIDKDKNIQHITRSFENYQAYGAHKAMAVAFDSEGKYVLGYAYDASSIESAKKIALHRCENANAHAEVKAEAPCAIYALENNIVLPLK